MMHDFRSIVLGGGIVGAATAEVLARRGERVLLLDRWRPAHDRGSSHGDGRIIRFTYTEPIYLAMIERAYDAWADLESRASTVLTETTGSWECGSEDSVELRELLQCFERSGIEHECWTPAESARRMPHFRLPPGSLAIYQADGGIVRAGRAVHTLWQLAVDAGATARSEAHVVGLDADDRGIAVTLADGTRFTAETLVVAAGGWTRGLLAPLDLELPLRVRREMVSHFPIDPHCGVDHSLRGMPTVIDYHAELPFYALPEIDVPGVKVGWHHSGPLVDPEAPVDMAENTRILEEVQRYVEARFHHLGTEPTRVINCLYTETPDYHFILDRHPKAERVVVGTGFSGHGFKFGPVAGEILADLAMDREPSFDLDTFRIDRFAGPIARRTIA